MLILAKRPIHPFAPDLHSCNAAPQSRRRSPPSPSGAGVLALVALSLGATAACAGTSNAAAARPGTPGADDVRTIPPPKTPLPPASATVGVTRFSFIAYGDTRGRLDGLALQHEHGLVVASMLRTIKDRASGPDAIRFVVSSGDAVLDGTSAQQWNTSFIDVAARLTAEGDVPIFPAAGNHDVAPSKELNASGRREGLGHFLSAFGALIPPDGSPLRLAGYPTYATGYGNTFLLVLDSNIADDPAQYAWVSGRLAELDRARYPNIVVAVHHPALSSGPHGGAIVQPQAGVLRARYLPLFRKHHVRLVLAGHEHFFEHWVERYQDASGHGFRLDEVVSGGGGAPPYAYQGEPDLRDYLKSGAAEKLAVEHLARPEMNAWENPYHYVVVHVDGTRLRIEVVGVDAGRDFQPYRSRETEL